jgi:hypothetical protein
VPRQQVGDLPLGHRHRPLPQLLPLPMQRHAFRVCHSHRFIALSLYRFNASVKLIGMLATRCTVCCTVSETPLHFSNTVSGTPFQRL